ncbi:hypothetical protein MMC08_001812 [Hypocenomyce scalaris]|nr:hypothetical protein [Hypocenomyce scalaris]
MKPLQKVVTAQDVQSSLYYLHVDNPADEHLRAAINTSQELEMPSVLAAEEVLNKKSPEAVLRKPLTSKPQLAWSDHSHFHPISQVPQSRIQLSRKPVNAGSSKGIELSTSPPALPPRGLLGPRPFHQRLYSVDSAALDPAPGRENLSPRRWSEQPPGLPSRPESRRKEVHSEQRVRGSAKKSETSESSGRRTLGRSHWWSLGNSTGTGFRNDKAGNSVGPTESQRRDFSVTLIRRDPGSGGQWNIGKILSNSSQDEGRDSSGSKRTTSSTHANSLIDIEINVPGYLKFTVPNATNISKPSCGDNTSEEIPLPELNIPQDRVFRRQLWTGRPASDRRSDRNSSLYNYDANRRSSTFGPSFDSPKGSNAEDGDPRRAVPSEGRPPSIKDYTFQSPWSGLCEFTTGIAGRSLKCKHTLISSSNPSAAASQPVSVSELRFNLPSSKIFRPANNNKNKDNSGSEEISKRSLVFSMQHARTASSELMDKVDEDEGNEERLDLSLGQELAGGGFAGKAAKLGKLIVEDEGLKMLDLLVAANMGVWWRVWEKGGG